MDWEVLRAIGFILLASAGLVWAGIAAWYYFLAEHRESNGVPVAIGALVVQYGLAYSIVFSMTIRVERLLSIILVFLIAIALAIAVWVGLRAHSRAGRRIALAGFFTLGAYFCLAAKLLF